MTTATVSTVDTPIGPFTVMVDADGAVLASGWTGELDQLITLVHQDFRPVDVRRLADLGPVTAAVQAYHGGELSAVDGVPVRQRGGPFLERAWDVLRAVPAGAPMSYTELAAKSGRPTAVRGAATACARNAVALFVPCHRVVRADGGLGGFRWDLPVKQWLLAHERSD